MQQISSILSHLANFPRATGVLTLGSFHNPHGSSSQLLWTPVDLHPCPRYESQQNGLSIWFSLCSDSHRLISSHPTASNDFPIPVDGHGCGDLSPELQLPHPRCRLVPRALLLLSPSSLSLLSFVLLSSVWMRIFLLSSQGFLPVFTWPSVRTAASLDFLDASVEQGVPHFCLPLHHLVHPIYGCTRNEFPFLLSNIAITTHV